MLSNCADFEVCRFRIFWHVLARPVLIDTVPSKLLGPADGDAAGPHTPKRA